METETQTNEETETKMENKQENIITFERPQYAGRITSGIDDKKRYESLRHNFRRIVVYPPFPVRCGPSSSIKKIIRYVPRELKTAVLLPQGYRATKCDVINGRGKRRFNHVGNRRYGEARTKDQKTAVVHSVLDAQREISPSSGFVSKRSYSENLWMSTSNTEATEKVGRSMRDMMKISNHLRRSRNTPNNEDDLQPAADSDEHILQQIIETIIAQPEQNDNISNQLLEQNETKPERKQTKRSKSKKSDEPMQKPINDDEQKPSPPIKGGKTMPETDAEPSSANEATSAPISQLTDEQQRVLFLLENGFEGTVDELYLLARA